MNLPEIVEFGRQRRNWPTAYAALCEPSGRKCDWQVRRGHSPSRSRRELQDAIKQGQGQSGRSVFLSFDTPSTVSLRCRENRLVRFVPGDVEGEPSNFWDMADGLVS